MTLQEYLQSRYRSQTVHSYLMDIAQYINIVGEEKAKTATYQDMINYVGKMREKYDNIHSICGKLTSIKSYYSYLVQSGQRKDHPCRTLYLKDSNSRPLQLQDLFTTQELQLMESSLISNKQTIQRDKVIMSLLINQAATAMEVTELRTEDINLEAATIALKYGENIQARTLPLHPKQIMQINNYLQEERNKLLAKSKDQTKILNNQAYLIINTAGSKCTQKDLYYLMKKLRYLFPEKYLNTQIIRQSVIANLLKEGKSLRAVQAFAGHKHVISTEKYKQKGIEELKSEIEKYHPLQ